MYFYNIKLLDLKNVEAGFEVYADYAVCNLFIHVIQFLLFLRAYVIRTRNIEHVFRTRNTVLYTSRFTATHFRLIYFVPKI